MKSFFPKSVLLATIFIVGTQSTSAQTIPTPTAAPTPPISASASLQLAIINVGVAEGMREMLINVRTTSRLVAAYEAVVIEACMPEMKVTYRHPPNPSDPTCREYLNKLITVDPGNPVAICARDGIDAPACSKAFSRQQYNTYDPAVGLKGDVKSGPNIDAQVGILRNEGRVESLDMKYLEFARAYRTGKSPTNREGALKILDQLLELTCRGVELVISPPSGSGGSQLGFSVADENQSGPTPTATPRHSDLVPDDSALPQPAVPGASTSSNPLQALARELADHNPTPVPDKLDQLFATRIRVLPILCNSYIEKAKLLDPNRASVVCAHEGPVSPNCISAKRLARQRSMPTQAQGAKGSGSLGHEDFGTF